VKMAAFKMAVIGVIPSSMYSIVTCPVSINSHLLSIYVTVYIRKGVFRIRLTRSLRSIFLGFPYRYLLTCNFGCEGSPTHFTCIRIFIKIGLSHLASVPFEQDSNTCRPIGNSMTYLPDHNDRSLQLRICS